MPTKNTTLCKTVLQKWRYKDIPRKRQKLREFITTRPAFQEMLKGVFQVEMKGHKVTMEKIRKHKTHL